MSQPQANAGSESSPARPRKRGDAGLALGLAASVVLFGLACRELLRFAPRTNLKVSFGGDVEEFFFEPSDSSPLVVLLLCGWLLWRRRKRLAALWGLHGSPWLTAALWLTGTGVFTWSVRSGSPELQAVALLPMLLGAGNLLGGPAAVRVMALPAITLLFALPIPAPLLNEILWALQIWTANFTGVVVQAMGFAAFVSGDQIIMSDGLFQIIETCSGLRAIETLGMLSILMVDLFERRGWHAFALIAASLPVAFLINGLRCVGLIFNPHADIASVHSLQGILMLLIGVLLLYFLDGWLARIPRRLERLTPIERRARSLDAAARGPLIARVGMLTGFALFWVSLSWIPGVPQPHLKASNVADVVPSELDGWKGEQRRSDWLFLGRTGFRQPFHRSYFKAGREVDVFLGQARPRDRFRSYYSPKIAFPGGGWRIESEQRARLAGREVTLRTLRKGARRLLVAHWFEASPGLIAESARALFSVDRMGPPRQPLPVGVRLATPLAANSAPESAQRLLESFARELLPTLGELTSPWEVPAHEKGIAHLGEGGKSLSVPALRVSP